MDRKRQTAKYVLSDFLFASISWMLFNIYRYEHIVVLREYTSLGEFLMYNSVVEGQILIPVFWVVLFYFSGYYNRPYGKSRLVELFSTLVMVLIGSIFIFFVVVLNERSDSFEIYYNQLFVLLALQFLFIYIPRMIITNRTIHQRNCGELSCNVLIIGSGYKAKKIADELKRLKYNIVGFVPEEDGFQPVAMDTAVVGKADELPRLIATYCVDEIVVAVEMLNERKQQDILYSLYQYKLPVKVLVDQSNVLSKVRIRTVRDVPLIDVTDNNLGEAEKNIKLFADRVISALVLVLFFPVYLVVAFLVKRDSAGPVFFKQQRIGYMGKPFVIYKFRTMYPGAEKEGPLLSKEDDQRITPLGHILRKYRLDELPQFWNVLKGDMSIVGPRPERKYYIDQIVQRAPYYYLLHNVRPGITSLGMVKYGYAGNVDEMIQRLEYDMLYYENMSLILDLTIIIYTIKTVFTGKGI